MNFVTQRLVSFSQIGGRRARVQYIPMNDPGGVWNGNPKSLSSLERNIRSWTHASMRSLWPCSDSSRTPSFPSQLQGKIGLPRANPRGSLKSPSFSRIQTQLEKNDVVPTSSQDEALARYSVSREVPCSVLKWEMVLGSLDATPKVP